MTQVTVALPDEAVGRLRDLAARLRVSADDLVRISIEDLLGRTASDFDQTAERILKKNAELYRRLA